jgi:hypothetical protein
VHVKKNHLKCRFSYMYFGSQCSWMNIGLSMTLLKVEWEKTCTIHQSCSNMKSSTLKSKNLTNLDNIVLCYQSSIKLLGKLWTSIRTPPQALDYHPTSWFTPCSYHHHHSQTSFNVPMFHLQLLSCPLLCATHKIEHNVHHGSSHTLSCHRHQHFVTSFNATTSCMPFCTTFGIERHALQGLSYMVGSSLQCLQHSCGVFATLILQIWIFCVESEGGLQKSYEYVALQK